MSWSTSTLRVEKVKAEAAIDDVTIPYEIEPAAWDQVEAARRAAKELLKSVPGPFVVVSLSGHANGVGWQAKKGWANDCISVSVTQFTEAQ